MVAVVDLNNVDSLLCQCRVDKNTKTKIQNIPSTTSAMTPLVSASASTLLFKGSRSLLEPKKGDGTKTHPPKTGKLHPKTRNVSYRHVSWRSLHPPVQPPQRCDLKRGQKNSGQRRVGRLLYPLRNDASQVATFEKRHCGSLHNSLQRKVGCSPWQDRRNECVLANLVVPKETHRCAGKDKPI